MSIKLHYISEYSSTQGEYSGTQGEYLGTQELSLNLSISLNSHRKHHSKSTQKSEVLALAKYSNCVPDATIVYGSMQPELKW